MAERAAGTILSLGLSVLFASAPDAQAANAKSDADDRRVCVPADDGRSWNCGTPDQPPQARPVPKREAPAPPPFLMDPNRRRGGTTLPGAAESSDPGPRPPVMETEARAAPAPVVVPDAPVATQASPVAPTPAQVATPSTSAAAPVPDAAATSAATAGKRPAPEPAQAMAGQEPEPVRVIAPLPEPAAQAAPAPVPAATVGEAAASKPAAPAVESPPPVSAPVSAPTPVPAESRPADPPKPDPVVAPAPIPAPPATAPVRAESGATRRTASRTESEFLQLPPGSYTVQLAHADRPDGFPDLVAALGLDPDSTYQFAWRQGGKRSWFLCWGSFPTQDEASAAVQGLSRPAGMTGTWPRRVKALQDELRASSPRNGAAR